MILSLLLMRKIRCMERIRSGSDDGRVNGDGEFRIENVPTGRQSLSPTPPSTDWMRKPK